MKINNITHVFFDLDHTLWDFDKNSALTFEKIFKQNKVDISLSEFLEVYVPINLSYWKLYREDKIDKASLRYGRLNDAFTALDLKIKMSMIHKLSEDYITYLCSFNHLFDGTKEILEYLKPNYNLHIITNGFKEVQQGKLNQSNINHYFDTVTNSEMVGVKKPNPRIFQHALDKARAIPDHSIMIGDNYEAIDVGLDAICFNYHNEDLHEDIKEINSLLEIKNYL